MTNRERFLIGGVGGLAPVLMFLATDDLERFFTQIVFLKVFGYFVKTIVLFFIGGFVASLYREEQERVKVFQLGVGAPAMIAGFFVAASSPAVAPAGSAGHTTAFIAIVHAQSTSKGDEIKRFTLPAPSGLQDFVEGLTGFRPSNVWFVIEGSFLSLANAKAEAARINKSFPGFHADVYAPYGDNPNYAVVIGDHLTQADAKTLSGNAVKAGLNKATYYKTFPNLPPSQ